MAGVFFQSNMGVEATSSVKHQICESTPEVEKGYVQKTYTVKLLPELVVIAVSAKDKVTDKKELQAEDESEDIEPERHEEELSIPSELTIPVVLLTVEPINKPEEFAIT